MEAFQTARTNLFDSFNREFYTLEKALSEELTRLARVNERHRNIIDGEPTVPYKAYEALRERHTSLTQQYSNLQNAHNKTIEKWRAAKAHIKTWETYHERCKARERAKNAKEHSAEHGRRHDPDTGATGAEPIANDGSVLRAQLEQSAMPSGSPMLMPGLTPRLASQRQGLAKPPEVGNNSFNSSSIVNQRNGRVQEGVQSARSRANPEASSHQDDETDGLGHGADELPTPKPGSGSQATAGKPLQPDASGYSSDQPVIVSERSLKKRKRQLNVRTPGVSLNEDVQEVGSVAKPIHVKSENNSSSPAPAPGRRGDLVMQDSLDLDDVGARLITPRKRRRLQELLRLSQSNPSTAGVGLRLGQAAQRIQPLEGPTACDLAMSPNVATEPSERKKQNRVRLFQGIQQPTMVEESTGPFIEPEQQLNAEFDNPLLNRKDGYQEVSPSLQRPKQPLRKLNANILRPQRVELLNTPAEVISLAASNTPENGNDHKRLTSQFLKVDDQLVRGSSAPPKADTSENAHPDRLAAVKAEGAKVLQPTNSNAQIQPRTSELKSTLKRQKQRSRHERIADRMPLVTEDGENFSESNHCRGAKPAVHESEETADTPRQHDQEKVDLQVHRRLASLLDEPSPEKALLSPTSPSIKATKAISKSPSRPSAHPRTGDSASHVSGKSRATANTPNRGRSPMEHLGKGPEPRQVGKKSVNNERPSLAGQQPPPTSSNDPDPDPYPIDPDHEPLRARPLHRLGPDDFKINPNNNQGLDYAFTEVVRNHDQRNCLPGCTRPSCCGSAFRKLVEFGGLPTPRTSGLWSSSPPEDEDNDMQDQADAHLLKEYLGADHERRLKGMSEAQRKEVLLDAKTRVFADRHGRHRQAFERRATPPGFWRTDMPSTQEVEMDREEARVLERRRVEEMYRGSMREGGRWRFRDE